MKKVLALDISTKTGWAFFKGEELKEYGTLFPEANVKEFGDYPRNYVLFSDYITLKIAGVISRFYFKYADLEIVIEETTKSRQNYSQKILEYIHYGVNRDILIKDIDVSYVRTGVWRRITGAVQTAKERSHNSKVARIKRKTGNRLAKIDGKVTRKFDRKDYALRVFKETFGKELPRKMEDACDAALVGLAFIKGCPICDGTITGGV